jgi:hypothetical protein
LLIDDYISILSTLDHHNIIIAYLNELREMNNLKADNLITQIYTEWKEFQKNEGAFVSGVIYDASTKFWDPLVCILNYASRMCPFEMNEKGLKLLEDFSNQRKNVGLESSLSQIVQEGCALYFYLYLCNVREKVFSFVAPQDQGGIFVSAAFTGEMLLKMRSQAEQFKRNFLNNY